MSRKISLYASDTKVPVVQTRAEIEAVLTKFGATSFAYAMQPDRAVVMFEYDTRRVRFDLPLPAGNDTKAAKVQRERWRALFLAIKAKLVSVHASIETFEEAFLAHVVLADGSKVGDAVRPAIEHQYKTGRMTPLLGGPKP